MDHWMNKEKSLFQEYLNLERLLEEGSTVKLKNQLKRLYKDKKLVHILAQGNAFVQPFTDNIENSLKNHRASFESIFSIAENLSLISKNDEYLNLTLVDVRGDHFQNAIDHALDGRNLSLWAINLICNRENFTPELESYLLSKTTTVEEKEILFLLQKIPHLLKTTSGNIQRTMDLITKVFSICDQNEYPVFTKEVFNYIITNIYDYSDRYRKNFVSLFEKRGFSIPEIPKNHLKELSLMGYQPTFYFEDNYLPTLMILEGEVKRLIVYFLDNSYTLLYQDFDPHEETEEPSVEAFSNRSIEDVVNYTVKTFKASELIKKYEIYKKMENVF